MFCNQCEQTAHGTGCVLTQGVCGKDEDIQSLQETLLYGLKGMAAYASHARRLGKSDEKVSAFIEEALFATMTNVNFDMGAHLELLMECGRQNLRVMELLDQGHVELFGAPAPSPVREGTVAGPGILITGHDMLDLHDILKQCEGTDVKVYTHGEMLPAHMYPKLREHPNLAGHYGGAWQKQRWEFDAFAGPIVATTNCVLIPKPSYADRLFTTRVTAVPGGKRINDADFSAVIAKAKSCPALPATEIKQSMTGFHHDVILGLADVIVQAVKDGKISRFFVIGGCDGAEPGRNYFSDYAQATPADSFILTLGCGKFRIRDYDYGQLLGLPRLLDMGQCNNGFGRSVQLRGQRPAADLGGVLVRAEGRGRAADPAGAGRQARHDRAESAGLHHAERVQSAPGHLRPAADRQGRQGGSGHRHGELIAPDSAERGSFGTAEEQLPRPGTPGRGLGRGAKRQMPKLVFGRSLPHGPPFLSLSTRKLRHGQERRRRWGREIAVR
jgi:hydroxylamine reductase